MFKFLKNLSGKAKKIMLSVGTGVVAASAMAIAACAEGAQGADGSAATLDISTMPTTSWCNAVSETYDKFGIYKNKNGLNYVQTYFSIVSEYIESTWRGWDQTVALLPDSPFRNISFGKEFDYWLGVLNYYVPFNSMVIIAGSWIACIAVYYMYQLILRKVSAIN